MKWTDRLKSDVLERLRNCKSRKSDIPDLVNARWASLKEEGKGFTKEDALVSILVLLDCNGQDFGADLTVDDYDELCR